MIDVYLLPGLDGTGKLFQPLIAAKPGWARPVVIQYDKTIPKTYQQLSAEVLSKIRPGSKRILIGESFSGPVAVLVAAQMQEDLIALVLSASFIKNPYFMLSATPEPILSHAVKFARKLTFLKRFLAVNTTSSKLLDAAATEMQAVTHPVVMSRLLAIRDIDVSQELVGIQCPILYLQATYDRVMPKRAYDDIKHVRSDVRMSKINTSHLLLQTQATKSWAAIEALIENAGG